MEVTLLLIVWFSPWYSASCKNKINPTFAKWSTTHSFLKHCHTCYLRLPMEGDCCGLANDFCISDVLGTSTATFLGWPAVLSILWITTAPRPSTFGTTPAITTTHEIIKRVFIWNLQLGQDDHQTQIVAIAILFPILFIVYMNILFTINVKVRSSFL